MCWPRAGIGTPSAGCWRLNRRPARGFWFRRQVAFVDVVGRALDDMADEAQRQVIELDGIAEELRSVDSGQQGLLPALVVVEACLRRERPFAERARALRRKARRVGYSLQSRYYTNETQVANVYRLVRGSERVTLFYEPFVAGASLLTLSRVVYTAPHSDRRF